MRVIFIMRNGNLYDFSVDKYLNYKKFFNFKTSASILVNNGNITFLE